VAVGTPIALFVGKGEDWKTVEYEEQPKPAKEAVVQQPQQQQQPPPPQTNTSLPQHSGSRKSTLTLPATTRLLKEHGVADTSSIPATGSVGQLLKSDVLKWLASNRASSATASPSTTNGVPVKLTAIKGNPKSNMAHSYSSTFVDLTSLSRVYGSTAIPVAECVTKSARLAQIDVPSIQSFAVADYFASGLSSFTGIIAEGSLAALSIGGRHAVFGEDGSVHVGFTLTLSADASLFDDAEKFLALVAKRLQVPNDLF
jgi:hypothetical protein